MSYAAAIDHLHGLGAELNPSAPRRKFDIAHMRILARALGDPQLRFPSVLIAGTNGKGSTASTLAHILAAAGLRTGLYTSPHLSRVTERIRLSTADALFAEIPEDTFARLYFHVDETAQRLVSAGELPHHPSFFESLTALAFLCFAEQQVDIAVLEVGLGGRLDATNIAKPLLSVLTDIALDHQEYLGDTLTEIAREKAGILRPNGTLITLPQHPEANQAIGEVAVALNVRGINAAIYLPDRDFLPPASSGLRNPGGPSFAPGAPFMAQSHRDMGGVLPPPTPAPTPTVCHSEQREESPHFAFASVLPLNHYDLHLAGETLHIRSSLAGEHQRRNLALAIAAAIELRNQYSYNIANAAIEAGIAATTWPGRLEFLPPDLLLDVAHNPAGAWTLRAALATLPEAQPRTLLFSCLRDKDLTEMARILFPLFDSSGQRPQDHIVFAPIPNPRAASLDELMATARALDVPAQAANSASEALALARSLTPSGGLVVATGSIYLIGAVRDAAGAAG